MPFGLLRDMRFNIAVVIAVVLTVGGSSSSALAIPFSDFVDFNSGADDFQTISDSNSLAARSWTHSVLDDLNGYSISDVTFLNASLLFTYSRTNGNEDWSLSQRIGLLSDVGDTPETKLFVLDEGALADLQADGVILFSASEGTVGNDTFRRYDATLTGSYTVKSKNGSGNTEAPEPTSAALVGMGLTGFWTFLRRRRSALKKEILKSFFRR